MAEKELTLRQYSEQATRFLLTPLYLEAGCVKNSEGKRCYPRDTTPEEQALMRLSLDQSLLEQPIPKKIWKILPEEIKAEIPLLINAYWEDLEGLAALVKRYFLFMNSLYALEEKLAWKNIEVLPGNPFGYSVSWEVTRYIERQMQLVNPYSFWHQGRPFYIF